MEQVVIQTTYDLNQAKHLYLEYSRRHQLHYAFNSSDAKVYQSSFIINEEITDELFARFKASSVLLDHIQYVQFIPNQQVQPVFSQFKQEATQFVTLPHVIAGKIGFNLITSSTFEDLQKLGVQIREKTDDKTIYKLNTLLFHFSNPTIVQHEQFIILSSVSVFSQEFNMQSDSLPGQEVYTIFAEQIRYSDRSINLNDYFKWRDTND